MNIEIKELLRGYKADLKNIQVAGNMCIVPLVSEQEFTNAIGEVTSVNLKDDINYGEMEFVNRSSKVGVILQGATIITRQRAQDRTVPQAHVLKGKATAKVNVFCVESTQPGYINVDKLADEFKDEPIYRILPPMLRAKALTISTRAGHQYGNLWRTLEEYSADFSKIRASSSLKNIYDGYQQSLNEFVAQFEPVPNQLGAIVFIDTQVVAIDIMPTYKSWLLMWKTLIRDSYGAEAVRAASEDKAMVWDYNLDISKIKDLDSLEKEMHLAVDQLIAGIRQEWEKVDNVVVAVEQVDTIKNIRLVNIESDTFVGQAVIHDEHVVYASILPKGSRKGKVGKFKSRTQSSTYSNDDFLF